MNSTGTRELDIPAAQRLGELALTACGASPATAPSVVRSCVIPEAEGLHSAGLAHLVEYCQALKEGRVNGSAEPEFTRPTPVLFNSDARGGFPHPAFDLDFDAFNSAVLEYGIGLLTVSHGFSCGALGYFAGRLAEQGLVALAATNASAMLAASGSTRAVFSTNPLAFAAPRTNHAPLLIDQSSSHSAFVNIQAAAREGREIPPGWALDLNGRPTTDPGAAMEGVLLAFGGARGANIALMVEILAAGLSASNWSLDAPTFNTGHACPGVGLCITGINPALLDADFARRCDSYLERIESEYGAYIPGTRRAANRGHCETHGLQVAAEVVRQLEHYADLQ